MSFIIYKVASRINKLSTTVQEEQSYMSTLVQETFQEFESLRLMEEIEEVEDKFANTAERLQDKEYAIGSCQFAIYANHFHTDWVKYYPLYLPWRFTLLQRADFSRGIS